MKMNNLSNPSRVILSVAIRHLGRCPLVDVIHFVEKDLAIAFALFAFAACSDYLQDFQDKYDDGNAFAEISSDSDNGSDDSELSSSSKGDVESSDSTDSSSSATDPGSSSSVAESSSSAFESCTGTVIYDASDDPLKTAFGTKFVYQGRFAAENVDADENGLNLMFDGFTYANLDFDKTRNISSWEGLCIEYTADAIVTLYLSSTGDDGQNAGETNQMAAKFNINPTSKKQVFEAMWKDAIKSADFNYDKVSILSFGSDRTANLVVSKITTIAKDVDLNAGASSEDPSTGYILSTNECPGTEIYNEDKGNIFKFDVASWNEGNTTKTLTNMSLTGDTGVDGVYFFMADPSLGKTISIKQWGGLCLEYTSTNGMYVEIGKVLNSKTRALASSTLPAQKTKIAYAIPLNAFYDVYVDVDISFVNERFNSAEVNRISFTNINVGTTQASISRITTLYPGVTFE